MRRERKAYYEKLEATQKGDGLDITPWLEWFLGCLDRAIGSGWSKTSCGGHAFGKSMPRRRSKRKVINRLLNCFEGALSGLSLRQRCAARQSCTMPFVTSLG
jgi:Fic family protein